VERLASPLLCVECAASASRNRPAQGLPMVNSYLFETLRGAAAVNRLQIATLISNLSWAVDTLTAEIEREESRAGVRDLSAPSYPALARSLRIRRGNIEATITALEALCSGKDMETVA
jgi:hypothetical protein